jgi:competence ComEA-like helix-hairpin-helix protein
VTRTRLLLSVWAFAVLGLAVRAFADGVLRDRAPEWSVTPVQLDMNRASVAELTVLPGIGRTRAEAIVLARIRQGPFAGLDDLQRVDGLGPTTLEALRDVVVFGPR